MPIDPSQKCPHCGAYRSMPDKPALTVDIIIERGRGDELEFVLVRRKNPPHGWAIPGGFVDYGESVEHAAIREAQEETNLDITITTLLGVYSDPGRDPRGHTVSVAFIATGAGLPYAKDDAEELAFYTGDNLPDDLVFDHRQIISDYLKLRNVD
jgi:ADP-ribose pyrophosphatase YjhB (NUDIX family)